MTQHRNRNKELGYFELVAIALGGMVGGGIFTILGISVARVGNLTPVAIIIGGVIALLAAYSYVKLGLYYKDEGATYSFFKRTYTNSPFLSAIIGWFVIFGYVSTLALYAYTFSSYGISGTSFSGDVLIRKALAIGVIGVFTTINILSVNGMGKVEDALVYTKLVILVAISYVLMAHGTTNFGVFMEQMAADAQKTSVLNILIVSSITFVAYEGFQLVINAVKEMKNPDKNIPRAIYSAIVIAVLIYVVVSLGALFSIPIDKIIENKEYALAAGAKEALGILGRNLVILGALLATSSAISGTVFGSSRQLAVIATDGYFPAFLGIRSRNIPVNALLAMALTAALLVLAGGLELILEFGSITFLMVSLLMSLANFKIRSKTNSSLWLTLLAIIGLSAGGLLILYYEFSTKWLEMLYILGLYALLTLGAYLFARRKRSD